MSEEGKPKRETFAKYLKRHNLSIEEMMNECGRGRNTLDQWFHNDPQLIQAIAKAAMTTKFLGNMQMWVERTEDKMEQAEEKLGA